MPCALAGRCGQISHLCSAYAQTDLHTGYAVYLQSIGRGHIGIGLWYYIDMASSIAACGTSGSCARCATQVQLQTKDPSEPAVCIRARPPKCRLKNLIRTPADVQGELSVGHHYHYIVLHLSTPCMRHVHAASKEGVSATALLVHRSQDMLPICNALDKNCTSSG